MPQFSPGQAKAARVPITVKPSGLICEAEVFLGPNDMTRVASSGRLAFTSTGASQDVRLPIAMPTVAGTYHVYIDVYVYPEGLRVAAYQALEDVVIIAVPGEPPDSAYVKFGQGLQIMYSDIIANGPSLALAMKSMGSLPHITAQNLFSAGLQYPGYLTTLAKTPFASFTTSDYLYKWGLTSAYVGQVIQNTAQWTDTIVRIYEYEGILAMDYQRVFKVWRWYMLDHGQMIYQTYINRCPEWYNQL